MIKQCKYCKKEFSARINKTYCCNSEECVKQKNHDKYFNKLYDIKCVVCEQTFKGRKKLRVCSQECKAKLLEKNIKITQELHCKVCGIFIKNKAVLTNVYGDETISRIKNHIKCSNCKEITLKNWSNRQKGENNTNWRDVKKVRLAKYTEEEWRIKMSQSNPMKNEDVKLKVSETLKQKYKTGEIVRPLGQLSTLWKGNRKKSFTIRDRIIWWKKENLERANYKCEICGEKGKLEIHHITPFREILSDTLNGRILENLTYDEFEVVCNIIDERHKTELGLVVCKTCHSNVDSFRKLKII